MEQYDSSLGLTPMTTQTTLPSRTTHQDWSIMKEKLSMLKVGWRNLWAQNQLAVQGKISNAGIVVIQIEPRKQIPGNQQNDRN